MTDGQPESATTTVYVPAHDANEARERAARYFLNNDRDYRVYTDEKAAREEAASMGRYYAAGYFRVFNVMLNVWAAEDLSTVPDAELHAAMRHPDFEYRTTEGPRKQWYDVDVPPADNNGEPDPTWERNTDAGRDGWDRFDYTEESYWRRRKTQPTEE